MQLQQQELVVEPVAQIVQTELPHAEEELNLLWMVQLILEEVELVHLPIHHHQLEEEVVQA
tara:strand:- start:28 stop:210 length:183 start_codon:yes stop_codon:yes gene_type:complete